MTPAHSELNGRQSGCSVTVVLGIGSNFGLKFGQEHPIRVLSPHSKTKDSQINTSSNQIGQLI